MVYRLDVNQYRDRQSVQLLVEKLLLPEQADTIPGGPSVILAMEDEETRNNLANIFHDHDFGVNSFERMIGSA